MKHIFYNTICRPLFQLMPSVSFEIAVEILSKATFHNADSKRCWDCVSSFNSKTLLRNRASAPQSFDSLSKARMHFYCERCVVSRTDYEKKRQKENKRRKNNSSS
jgi:hypothetical protein